MKVGSLPHRENTILVKKFVNDRDGEMKNGNGNRNENEEFRSEMR